MEAAAGWIIDFKVWVYFKLSLDRDILKVGGLDWPKFLSGLFSRVAPFFIKLELWFELLIALFTRFSKTCTSDYFDNIWDYILFSGATYSI